jgi:hypothetical protein
MTDTRKTLTRMLTPEDRELESKRLALATFEAELAQRELDLATLQGTLRAFESRYVRTVGVLYRELDELKAQIAEAEARQDAQDPKLRDEAATARARAAETASATDAALGRKHGVDFAPGDDLKKLFREIAKRVHPDLTTDPKERARRTRVMADANRAYAEGDEAKLQAILEAWYSSPEAVEGEGTGAELVRTIRKIHQVERRLAEIAATLTELTRTDLYELMRKVEVPQASGQDVLAQMAEELRKRIAHARSRLDGLVQERAARER